jgi:hypothetical protein
MKGRPFDDVPHVNVVPTLSGQPEVMMFARERTATASTFLYSPDQALALATRLVQAVTDAIHSQVALIDPGAADELAIALENI